MRHARAVVAEDDRAGVVVPAHSAKHEIADGGIGAPGATKRRRLNSCGMPLRRKTVMSVAASIDLIWGKFESSVSEGTGSAAARSSRPIRFNSTFRRRFSVTRLRFLLATRPARQELLVAHSCPPSR